MHDAAWLNQTPYEIRAEWGPRGAREAARRGDVVVLVDVLSFSTAVTAAVEHGATIAPFPWGRADAAAAEAERIGAKLRTDRSPARRALSPLSFSAADRGGLYLLTSPNGATCSRIAADAPVVFAGCLRNATAVARAAEEASRRHAAAITVIPCGEIWPDAIDDAISPQRIRPCVEDALGAGAVAAACMGTRSPEAQLLVDAFEAARPTLGQTMLDCASGRELIARGYQDDVAFAAQVDAVETVPELRDGRYAK